MTAHSTAKGIASLGRHGDDLIVHMNQEEVQGLQALAKQHGTSLTINPDTGMPEAFKLGGVFKALIPVAAGVMFPGFGASIFGGMQGIGAGILAGAATAALTGGNPLLGGITGALGGYSGAGLGNSLANLGAAGTNTATNTANALTQATGANVMGNTLGTGASQFISPFTPSGIAGGAGLGVGTVGNAGIVGQTALSNAATGNILTNQAVNAGLTGANNIANTGNVIQTVQPSYLDNLKAGTSKLFSPGGFDAYKASLPGTGGDLTGVTKDAAGNVVSSTYSPVKAATTMDAVKKIAMPVGGALLGGVEASDLNPQIDLKSQEKTVYEQTGVDAMGRPTYGYVPVSGFNPYRTLNLSGPGPLTLAPAVGASKSYAIGGTVTNPSVGGGLSDLYNRPEGQALENISNDGYGIGRLDRLASQESLNNAKVLGYADGGLTSIAKGGYLDGPGDGMSDSIPATINGKQPARLADGEFVVSADVVSHLGNGSTKAGSKKLYAMMDKVRKARTGTTKQGKQINPDKYLPV